MYTAVFEALDNDLFDVGPHIAAFFLMLVAVLIGLVTFIVHATKFTSSSGVMPAKTWKIFAAMYLLSFIFMCGGWLWFIPVKFSGYGVQLEAQPEFEWGHGVLISAMFNTIIAAVSTFSAAKQVASGSASASSSSASSSSASSSSASSAA